MNTAPAWAEPCPDWDLPVREAAARTLALAMSDISEETWCAAWHVGLSVILWEDMHRDSPVYLTAQRVAHLKALATIAGGWCRWSWEGAHDILDDAPGAGVQLVEWKDWDPKDVSL